MSPATLSKTAAANKPVGENMTEEPRRSRTPLPLVLAIVGHRDLIDEDMPRLRHQVASLLDRFAKEYHWSRPFELLCGLAEGADRLAAHIALQKGIHLIACLPMEADVYETDFKTNDSRREFRELLAKATDTIVLPLMEGNTAENISHDTDGSRERRDRQYAALGDYLVQHCQILIALWDGVDTGLPGGTSSVISRQRHGSFGEVNLHAKNPLAFPESGPVYHLLTPRAKNPAPPGDLEMWRLLHHSGFKTATEAQKRYDQLFHRMDAFNKDAAKIGHPHRTGKDRLIPKKQSPPQLDNLIDRYATADLLALSYQRRTRWVLRALIFLFGLGGVILFELFAHGPENLNGGFLFAYVAMVATAYLVYRIANLREVKTRHLDYRALAEGLRLQIFWKLSGLTDRVVDYYIEKQRTELDWICDAIQRWTDPIAAVSLSSDWTTIGQHWLQDQFAFFRKSARRNRTLNRIELGSYWALLGGLTLIGVAVLADQWRSLPGLSERLREPVLNGFSEHGLLVIAMTVLPALAGAITAYSLKMAFSEQGKQYDRMKDLYERGLVCFEKAAGKDSAERDKLIQKVVRELGKEALSENADWVQLHRERMVEMFVGG